MQVQKKSESKVLDRSYVEVVWEDKSGKMTRKEAVAALAQEMGVAEENIGMLDMKGESGSTRLVGRFHVYGSAESKKKIHPGYLDERSLTKEEREKLKQARKKASAPAPAPEAKK